MDSDDEEGSAPLSVVRQGRRLQVLPHPSEMRPSVTLMVGCPQRTPKSRDGAACPELGGLSWPEAEPLGFAASPRLGAWRPLCCMRLDERSF